ncbi:sigma-70 family RNA polymerase sigma factor [Pedobacter chinensis]|uniref:Sigma-70 family RNA polymerase sigma factor n=1 Tax=Pedobacter chinensis TaxID=2282421 RepID=A0A369PSM7_9SPHI|nr:sigma-70 family RNA polymerase sigma factor [Pedobacter chinensis]RDC55260.1 sigma-70 family RNA polymerase sigma factor [Pedobacter chinensis]
MATEISDIDLWHNLIKGNRIALNNIYSRFFSTLYQYGMRMLQDEDAVRDCIQNLFVRLWINHNKLTPVNNLRGYLISSLRNNIINFRAVEDRFQKVDLESNEVFDLKFTVESVFIQKEEQTEQVKQLSQAMNKLTARQKEIIYLRYFEELDYAEISEIMDLSVKGTYKLSARALEALREVLNIDKFVLLAILLNLKR